MYQNLCICPTVNRQLGCFQFGDIINNTCICLLLHMYKSLYKSHLPSKRIKHIGINLPKEAKAQYSDNCKMLMKEIRWHTKWKDILCSWIGRINVVKMTILPKAIYRFNVSPIKLLVVFSRELEQQKYLICMETQRPLRPKQSWERKMELEEWSWSWLYYKAIVIKIVWY